MERFDRSFFLLCLVMYSLCLETKSAPLSCNVSTKNSCTAFLYFESPQTQSVEQVADLFSVTPAEVVNTLDIGDKVFLINVTCSCEPTSNEFFARTRHSIKNGESWDTISTAFDGLVKQEPQKQLHPSIQLELKLLCGCLDYVGVMTYRVVAGDTLFALSTRFNADVNQTKGLNLIANESAIIAGDILFIPVPHPEYLVSPIKTGHKSGKNSEFKSRTGLIIGVASGVVLLVTGMILGGFYLQSKARKHGEETLKGEGDGNSQDLGLPNSWKMGARSSILSRTLPKESKSMSVAGFDSDKPIIFTYEEILIASDDFNISKKIGQGSFGAVYLGNLRNKEVAIKQMKDTKSKEFLAELKILCRVHHTNLVELIGYSAGGEHLFLVYEFAKNGALSDHLHDPIKKGYQPLPWISRVQIALDAARGLEYIHEHTKPLYVHRDIKTSNILLDENFRAKIADFGLVKLLEHSPESGTSTTKVVGTFGYLAPEYVRDGNVTTKSDVYAFGVVLMELITGQPALCRSSQSTNAAEWRSLISLILAILKDEDRTSKLKSFVDQGLLQYPEDLVMQMALLSKTCVDDDPSSRPDMKHIVIALSQMLLSSREWEAAEEGNSQIFSDLYQGR